MGAGNPGLFAPTSWWRTQSHETSLRWTKFPGNREKNREYCHFSTISTKPGDENVKSLSVLAENSLRIAAGNIIVRTGKWFSGTGIYWRRAHDA